MIKNSWDFNGYKITKMQVAVSPLQKNPIYSFRRQSWFSSIDYWMTQIPSNKENSNLSEKVLAEFSQPELQVAEE